MAAAAGIYAFIGAKEYAEAEELLDKFIPDPTICTDDNDIIFTAASKLYEAAGNKKKKRQIDKAMKEYEDKLAAYYEDEFPGSYLRSQEICSFVCILVPSRRGVRNWHETIIQAIKQMKIYLQLSIGGFAASEYSLGDGDVFVLGVNPIGD